MKIRPLVAFLCLLGWASLLAAQDEAKSDPAPAIDRVGFPTNYAHAYTILRRTTNPAKARQVTVYGNGPAASVTELSALPYPNGSVLVMETRQLQQDADGKVLADAEGKYREAAVLGLHVMRREAGFGADYGDRRAGEWEFVEYSPDGSFITPPAKSTSCSTCHLEKAGPARDYVFKARFAEAPK